MILREPQNHTEKVKISCPNHLLLFERVPAQPLLSEGTSLKMHFICFLFLANSSALEVYPGTLVIGAVSGVICMDTV